MERRHPLRRDTEKARAFAERGRGQLERRSELKPGSGLERTAGPKRTQAKPRRRAISPASPAQRAKVRDVASIVSDQGPCDPTHLVPRSMGGCDDPLCVVPLTRPEHRSYDAGELDLVPALVRHGMTAEMQHALGHLESPLLLVRVLTGERHVPASEVQQKGQENG